MAVEQVSIKLLLNTIIALFRTTMAPRGEVFLVMNHPPVSLLVLFSEMRLVMKGAEFIWAFVIQPLQNV